MGYNIRAGLVEEHAPLLTRIKAAVQERRPLHFNVPQEDLYSKQYKVRRILKATEVLRTEMGGKFAGLGEAVRVRADASNSQLIIEPKKLPLHLEQSRINEDDALETLSSYQGSLTTLEFFPSEDFSEEDLISRALEVGFRVYPQARIELEEDGLIKFKYPAERIEQKRHGFDILDRKVDER